MLNDNGSRKACLCTRVGVGTELGICLLPADALVSLADAETCHWQNVHVCWIACMTP